MMGKEWIGDRLSNCSNDGENRAPAPADTTAGIEGFGRRAAACRRSCVRLGASRLSRKTGQGGDPLSARGGVSRLRRGGNGEMGARGARGQHQAGVGLSLRSCPRMAGRRYEQNKTNVHDVECSADKGAMRGADLIGPPKGGSLIRNYVTAASG